jgi:hypothetical protein
VSWSSPKDVISAQSWQRMGFTDDASVPTGRLYFAQRKNPNGAEGPRFFVIWRPSKVDFVENWKGQRHGFHVFFHPAIHREWHWESPDYCLLPQRYLFDKGMVQQHVASGRKVMLVFPVASDQNQMGDLTSWQVLDRCLREILYFVVRSEKVSPFVAHFQKVGRVAVSGFSFGITHVTPIVQSAPADSNLAEVYDFDGIDHVGRPPDFYLALQAWFRRGQAAKDGKDRRFRIYCQDTTPDQEGTVSLVAPHAIRLPSDVVAQSWDLHTRDSQHIPVTHDAHFPIATVEAHDSDTAPTRSLISIPSVAWQGLIKPEPAGTTDDKHRAVGDVRRFYDVVHQVMVNFFLSHALAWSGFDR